MKIKKRLVRSLVLILCAFCLSSVCLMGISAATDNLIVGHGNVSDDGSHDPFDPDAGTVDGSSTQGVLDGVESIIDGIGESASDVLDDVIDKNTTNTTANNTTANDTTAPTTNDEGSLVAAIIVCIIIAVAVVVLVIILLPKKK